MPQTATCLWFDTQAEEAANFYVSVVPGSRITRVTRYEVETPSPARVGSVMIVEFELGGHRYQALNGGPQFHFSEAVSVVLVCESQEESDRLREALTADGEPGPCGWLKDRFGLSWQVYPAEFEQLATDPDPERRKAAMRTMLQQSRIDLAQIRAAMDAASDSSASASQDG